MQITSRGADRSCGSPFVAFAMQMHVKPYKEPEANILKALVDFQIFISFLCSFILRILARVSENFESLGAAFYGFVLVASFVSVLVVATLLVSRQVYRNRQVLRESLRLSLNDVDSPMGRALRTSLSGDEDARLLTLPCSDESSAR